MPVVVRSRIRASRGFPATASQIAASAGRRAYDPVGSASGIGAPGSSAGSDGCIPGSPAGTTSGLESGSIGVVVMSHQYRRIAPKASVHGEAIYVYLGASAGRTSAADTHDCDISTSDPVPVEYDSTRTTHASQPRRSVWRHAKRTPGTCVDQVPVRSTQT